MFEHEFHVLCRLDAAIVGQLKLVKMLVERGADPGFKNRKGKSPCDVAAAAVYNFLLTSRGKRHSASSPRIESKNLPETRSGHSQWLR